MECRVAPIFTNSDRIQPRDGEAARRDGTLMETVRDLKVMH